MEWISFVDYLEVDFPLFHIAALEVVNHKVRVCVCVQCVCVFR